MTTTAPLHRLRRMTAPAVVVLAVLALASCSSSKKAASPTSTTGATTTTVATVSSDSGPTTTHTVKAANAAVSAALDKLKATNNDFNSVNENLDQGRKLFATLETDVDDLVTKAPADLAPDAKTLQSSVHTLKTFVDNAKSVQDLQNQATSNSSLKTALTNLTTSGEQVTSWSTSNC